MDEARFWPPLLVLGFIVVGVFCFSYFDKVDKAEVALETTKSLVEQARRNLTTRQEEMAVRLRISKKSQSITAEIQAAQARISQANKMLEDARHKQDTVETDLRLLVNSVNAVAAKNRVELATTEIPELNLKTGAMLKNVKLKKFDDSSCSYIHSEGIGSMHLADLPADIAIKLDVGPQSITARLRLLQQEADPSSVVSKPDSTASSKALAAIRQRISDLESRIASVSSHKVKLESEVRDLELQIQKEENKGGYTFNLRTQRDIAEGNAGMVRTDLLKLEAELKRLKKEEEALRNAQ